MQLVVSDYQSATSFPTDPSARLSLSQKMGDIQSPELWSIGKNAKRPNDFVSIPLALNPPTNLKDLRKINPGIKVEGFSWNHKAEKYEPLNILETLRAGVGYWLGSRGGEVVSFSRLAAETLPTGSGLDSIHLRHGWNQIGNPNLAQRYWPFARSQGALYQKFLVKGLWEYNPADGSFVESDSLKPWRGYFVYNYLQDTAVVLSSVPFKPFTLNKEAATRNINLSLGFGTTRSLRLGAD